MESNYFPAPIGEDSSNSVLFFLRTFLTFLGLLVQLRTTNQATTGAATGGSASCPSQCLCVQVENRFNVDCSGATNLTNVPGRVPLRTMILKMDNAHLGEVRERQYFVRKDLSDVSTLSLRNCHLKDPKPRIFWGLYNLKELNLNKNEIRQIPLVKRGNAEVGPFVDMRNLQVLHLSSNNLTTFQTISLHGAINLMELDLSYNKLTLIIGFFDDFVHLKRIDLQNNKFKYFDPRTFEKLTNLKVLNLINNQYVCDCKLRKFAEWLKEKYLSSPPQCRQPNRLQQKSWDQIKAHEFACPPEMEPRKMAPLSVVKGRSVGLVCKVSGDPKPEVSWDFRNGSGYSTQLLMDNTKQYDFNVYSTVALKSSQANVTVYNLTIRSVDQSSIGVYHCIANNPADKDYVLFQVDLELPVQQIQTVGVNSVVQDSTSRTTTSKNFENNETAGGGNVVLIGIILGAMVSVLTAILIMILCYRHMGTMARESNASPVHQIQNGYGYHVIDSDVSKTSTVLMEKSPAKTTSTSVTLSKPLSSADNSSKCLDAKENFTIATVSTGSNCKLEDHNYYSSSSNSTKLTSVCDTSKPPRRAVDGQQQTKRVLRFAVDENPDKVPRFKPIYQERYEEDDVYGFDVRETEI